MSHSAHHFSLAASGLYTSPRLLLRRSVGGGEAARAAILVHRAAKQYQITPARIFAFVRTQAQCDARFASPIPINPNADINLPDLC